MSRKPKRANLFVETLEDRSVPTTNTISGFVYWDANQNGLFDTNEQPIANSQIQLQELDGTVVATTTSNAQGYYEFPVDRSPTLVDKTLTKTVSFGPTQTNFDLQGLLDQFDPSLGTLESIDIKHDGSITSTIKVENVSAESQTDISGNISGTLTLTGPGINNTLHPSANTGSTHLGAYDNNTDFGGTSGISFPQSTADDTSTITLTGSDMNAFVGTGKVTLNESAVATSSAQGGGNLDAQIRSTGAATVTVTYHYKASVAPDPHSYKVVQTAEPPHYSDGSESQGGSVIPNTIGTDFIIVGLTDHDIPNNNFGELKKTAISGHVWYDQNDDGIRQDSEQLIPGTTITLVGPGGATQTKTTDANGYYEFTDLDPGTYTLKETQPSGYLDGSDNAGSPGGGTVVNDPAQDQIQSITLVAGDSSANNDFGELKPASLAGHVYYDANNDGIFQNTETGISGATVTLTGFDDNGPVNLTATTDAGGNYKFDNLRPGTYAITETQPANYDDGKDTIGTPGGDTANDVFSNIDLQAGVNGVNNDFGEIKPDVPGDPLPKDVLPFGQIPYIGKIQATTVPNPEQYLDPTLRGQLAFIVGTSVTLTQHQPDTFEALAAVNQLRAGMTQAQFVDQLWNSDAHRALQVTSAYEDVLGRAPTASEATAGIAQLKGGLSSTALQEQLYVSNEFQQMHPTSSGLATALYTSILNVTPGTQATQNLLQSMGNETLDDVVHGLITSDASLSNLIDDAYHQVLRRAATQSEINTWLTPLKNGTMSLDDLSRRLLNSQEFYSLVYANVH